MYNHGLKDDFNKIISLVRKTKPTDEDRLEAAQYTEFHCYDVDANYPESACKYQLVENGVKSTYQYAIFDLNKKAIGILRADYVLDQEELSDEGHEALKYLAIKLPGYLVK